jgi:hypothetical protein
MADIKGNYSGVEFDWFLTDKVGEIALCSTAGFGEIPRSVVEDLPPGNGPIDQIEGLISHFPKSTDHTTEGHGPGHCKEWRHLADRGIWIYDWQQVSNRYELIVRPITPMTINDLNGDWIKRIKLVSSETVEFATLVDFDVSGLQLKAL